MADRRLPARSAAPRRRAAAAGPSQRRPAPQRRPGVRRSTALAAAGRPAARAAALPSPLPPSASLAAGLEPAAPPPGQVRWTRARPATQAWRRPSRALWPAPRWSPPQEVSTPVPPVVGGAAASSSQLGRHMARRPWRGLTASFCCRALTRGGLGSEPLLAEPAPAAARAAAAVASSALAHPHRRSEQATSETLPGPRPWRRPSSPARRLLAPAS